MGSMLFMYIVARHYNNYSQRC